ncbi:hypothetical protein [Hyalangium gracile]|uniref:hypothetical protein n=1 Tax=Hyalangium gracile TaxID=394092 RepID=UPI001CCC54BF|nr:hypothetical protein [Hyalangium gracile]
MNSRLLLAFLCIASLSTGCIIEDNGCDTCNPRHPGDVTFLWTFDGLRCDQARDVYGVNINIPGESLFNNGKYACSTADVDGITLHDFAPGSYSYNLQAVNFQNQIVFEASGTFVIDGNRTVRVDLAPTGDPTSYAYLNWNFPGGQSCFQAGVASVDIILDDLAPHNVPCTAGQSVPGLKTPALAPGEHYIEFIALDSQGRPLYYFNGGLLTRPYDPVDATYNLYTIGGASIAWRLSDGAVTFDCPASNPMVYVNFRDLNTGNWVYPLLGDGHRCSQKPIVYEFLRPGVYELRITTTFDGYEYRSNSNINVEVRPHVFPGPNSALDVTLFRRF